MPETTRYQLTRTIASGGMAQVYEATAVGGRGFERRVAIKRVLPEHQHDESMQRMFFDEAQIASHLHHGNIVQVIDYGLVDGAEFIAMEFVDGLDARRACRTADAAGTPISEALAFHIVAEVAYALEYIHDRTSPDGTPLGIVHRDVSPQNIMLSWDGDVKLADFGIAASFSKLEKTATGVVKGKLVYMPPEQAGAGEVGATADVYALGASLHAMLTGRPPMAEPEEMIRRLAGSPLELHESLSASAAELIRRCMAPEPDARPTAAALAALAGELARTGLPRDARGALRDWMQPLAAGPPKKRGALDDLMGLCLVATSDGDRQFTVSRQPVDTAREEAPPIDGAAHAAERTSQPPTTPHRLRPAPMTSAPPRPRRAWLLLPLIFAVVGLGAGAGVVLGLESGPREDGDAPPAAHAIAEVRPSEVVPGAPPQPELSVLPAALEVQEAPEGTAASPEAPDPDVEPASAPPARPNRARNARRPPRAEPVEAPRRQPAVASGGTGWLRIGHPRGAGQEQVFVDGRPVGYTPNLFQVGVGAHSVEIRSVANGETVARRTVRVRADHTRSAPSVMPR